MKVILNWRRHYYISRVSIFLLIIALILGMAGCGPPTQYNLTMAVAPGGSGTATDLTNASPYTAGTVVNITAVAAAGYQFANWTAPAGTFGSATAATTTFTMPAQNVTVTANFVPVYNLTMAVAPGGSGTATDLTNASPYTAGTVVNITAVAAAGYQFANWTAPAGTFGSATAATTTFTMTAQNVTVTANFMPVPPGPTGTVVIARPSLGTETFLPWTGGSLEKNYLSGTIYESLTMRTRDSTPTPCIATSWNMSADAKNWTFTIRQDIPFHDAAGNTYSNLTAADVKYTFERIASPASISPISYGLRGDLGSNVTAQIEVVDNATIVFHLVVSDVAFLKSYTGPDMMGVVCKSYIQAYGDAVAASNPVGTGPYVLDSHLVGSYIQLRVIDNWATHWRFGPLTASDPTKYFQYIKFMIVPGQNDRAQGLINNNYQMIEADPTVVPQIEADPNCQVLPDITVVAATDTIRMGGLDQLDTYVHIPADPIARYDASRPWADNTTVGNKTAGQLVRQALNLAINKTALLNTTYAGVGGVAAAPLSIPEWISALSPYPYDPALAQTYLTDAGYGSGFNVTLIYDQRYSNALLAVAVKSYWDAIGVNTTVQLMTWINLRAVWLYGGNTPGNLATGPTNYAWVFRTPPPMPSSGDPALAVNTVFDPASAFGDYSEPTEDALRLAYLAETDPALRTQKLKDLGAYVNAQATQVFLVSVYTPIGVRKTLAEPRDVFDLKENPELIHRV